MIVLGIETATIEVGVCLWGDDGPIASFMARPGRRHVETLHPALSSILSTSKLSLADVDAIAVDIGPGLFTGLRVGIAAAKALAFARSTPIIGLRSTEILAHRADGSAGVVVPVVDMRRGDVAWELFSPEDEVALGTPNDLGLRLAKISGPVHLVGDGARRYFTAIVDAGGGAGDDGRWTVGSGEFAAPSVLSLCAIAHERLVTTPGQSSTDLSPLYLRDADAKANFSTRLEKIPAPSSVATLATDASIVGQEKVR